MWELIIHPHIHPPTNTCTLTLTTMSATTSTTTLKRSAAAMDPEPTTPVFGRVIKALGALGTNHFYGSVCAAKEMVKNLQTKGHTHLSSVVIDAIMRLVGKCPDTSALELELDDVRGLGTSGVAMMMPAVVPCTRVVNNYCDDDDEEEDEDDALRVRLGDGPILVQGYYDWSLGIPFDDECWVAGDTEAMYNSDPSMMGALRAIVPGKFEHGGFDMGLVSERTRRVFISKCDFAKLAKNKSAMELAATRNLVLFVYK
jgi:hypothetical protein